MILLLIIVLVIGLAGIIGNQYSMIRQMEDIKKALREIKDNKDN